MYKSYFPYYPD